MVTGMIRVKPLPFIMREPTESDIGPCWALSFETVKSRPQTLKPFVCSARLRTKRPPANARKPKAWRHAAREGASLGHWACNLEEHAKVEREGMGLKRLVSPPSKMSTGLPKAPVSSNV